MKYLLTIFCFFVTVLVLARGNIIQQFRDSIKKCSAEMKNTKFDLVRIVTSRLVPNAHDEKCYLSCMYKNFGAQTGDGTIDGEGAIKAIEELKDKNNNIYNSFKETIEKCSKEVETEKDECEIAAKFTTCGIKESAQINLRNVLGILKIF